MNYKSTTTHRPRRHTNSTGLLPACAPGGNPGRCSCWWHRRSSFGETRDGVVRLTGSTTTFVARHHFHTGLHRDVCPHLSSPCCIAKSTGIYLCRLRLHNIAERAIRPCQNQISTILTSFTLVAGGTNTETASSGIQQRPPRWWLRWWCSDCIAMATN